MGLFDKHYSDVTAFLDQKKRQGIISEHFHTKETDWPSEKNRNLVLGQDTAVELGNPKNASTSFLLWANKPDTIKNGRITIVGRDLPHLSGKQVSFGKIVIVDAADFNEDNTYDRYREMELLRYDIHLKGYMMRGVSQQQREWSRVSNEAITKIPVKQLREQYWDNISVGRARRDRNSASALSDQTCGAASCRYTRHRTLHRRPVLWI